MQLSEDVAATAEPSAEQGLPAAALRRRADAEVGPGAGQPEADLRRALAGPLRDRGHRSARESAARQGRPDSGRSPRWCGGCRNRSRRSSAISRTRNACSSASICRNAGNQAMTLKQRNAARAAFELATQDSLQADRYVLRLYVIGHDAAIGARGQEPAGDLRRIPRGALRPGSRRHLPAAGPHEGRADHRRADADQEAPAADAPDHRRHVEQGARPARDSTSWRDLRGRGTRENDHRETCPGCRRDRDAARPARRRRGHAAGDPPG